MRSLLRGVLVSAFLLTVPGSSHGQTAQPTATTTSATPVFGSADSSQAPLRIAATGSVLLLLEADGDWCHIEFEDPQYGRRTGYVQTKLVRISIRATPIDLSVPEARVPETGSPNPRSLASGRRSSSGQGPVRTVSGGVLDEISLYVESPPRDAVVLIRLFSATDSDLGTGDSEGKETRQTEAHMMQEQGPKLLADQFVATLKASGPFRDVAVLAPDTPPSPNAIVIEGKFTTIDPGSRAKRYWVGFGAGKSRVAVSGAVKSADGNLLATFSQDRLGVMGLGGGDSLGKLSSDSRDIGQDIAKFVSAWANGTKLK